MPVNLPRRRAAWPSAVLALALLLSLVLPNGFPSASAQEGALSSGVVVLVNDSSAHYSDFQRLVQPYLDHFGIPYTLLNVRTAPIGPEIGTYALILIGHRQLDPTGTALDLTEQGRITAAVNGGTGLVSLDNDLSPDGSTARYQFIDNIWGFGYKQPAIDWSVTFVNPAGEPGIVIDCSDDLHQEPVLTTSVDASSLVPDDGLWTEFAYPPRGIRALFADADEVNHGLQPLRCYSDGIPTGNYQVSAYLFTDGRRPSMRYYFGYSAANPTAYFVDTESGSGGEDRFTEYVLSEVSISNGTFQIYAQDAELLTAIDPPIYPLLDPYTEDLDLRANPALALSDGVAAGRAVEQSYPTITQTLTLFGWASIRLTEVGTTKPPMPYITANHAAGEWLGTGSMTMAGLGPLPEGATVLARSSSEPFLLSTSYGEGRAVQWGSYDWMSHAVKGPMRPLDDLVWRSIVWAARKPFALQGMPPFLTMRVDDVAGPFDWLKVANEFGLKPWVGLFHGDMGPADTAELSALVHAGLATASVHAVHGDTYFYYDHFQAANWPDDVMAGLYADAWDWHIERNIPISTYVVPHTYEIGTNAFQGLRDWGVEFLATVMAPGTPYGSPWVQNGPFRLYETANSDGGTPLYYADWIQVPGHPEFDGQFFNCATEIRDDGGYEWYPSNDVLSSIGRGTRHVKRALDNMAIPNLMTHEYFLDPIEPQNWRATIEGITANLAPYNLIHVTVDEACQYARAMRTSHIQSSSFNPLSGSLTIDVAGSTDMPTRLYLFTESNGTIQSTMLTVPEFSGSTRVTANTAPAAGAHRIFLPLLFK
jgi:hypothetical protein